MILVSFEKKEKYCIITLNQPKKRNALSTCLIKELKEKLLSISKDKKIHVVILRGNGPIFSSGHDLNELIKKEKDIAYFKKIFSKCSSLMETIKKLPQPVIAQVHGMASAAGLQLVLSCDLAIADTKTKFSTPGVKIGLFCITPMVPLSRIISRKRALDMLFTGRDITAKEALEFGMINKVVEPEKLSKETEKMAEKISKYSLYTLSLGKKTFYEQIEMDEKAAYDYAIEKISENCLSYDAREGISAFLEKRKPNWKDK